MYYFISMDYFIIIYVLSSLFNCLFGKVDNINLHYRNLTCGNDKSSATVVYEGVAAIDTYPWMGTLLYPMGTRKITTTVVLVTRQIVLAAANDIDLLPKENLRQLARVVLGRDCTKPGIKIRDYTFHPGFRRDTYSALALIQLDVDIVPQELRPICGPPSYFINPEFYAMTVSDNCQKGQIQIRRMKYVDKERCKRFYKKSELDDKMFWPSHTTCARALSGGKCMWRSGTVLVVKQDGHWRLLGFGLQGPGCQSPARFLDYGMQEQWVRKNVARIGQPAITRMGTNYLIMRRPLSSVQRFGPCDPEETKYEMYTDRIQLHSEIEEARAIYNVTLIHGVEYSCVILKVDRELTSSEERGRPCSHQENPKLHLRRWCSGPPQMCYGFQYLELNFYLDIEYNFDVLFYLAAYGKSGKIISPLKAMLYVNKTRKLPDVMSYEEAFKILQKKRQENQDMLLKFYFPRFVQTFTNEPRQEEGYLEQYYTIYKFLLDGQKG